MRNYAPRISLPAKDLSKLFELWSENCLSMAVYEHEADEEVKTTHVHILMLDCKYKTSEALKRIYHNEYPEDARKGNALWAWEHEKPPNITFLTYMAKGRLRPVFVKNISPAVIEEYTSKWVEADKPDTSRDKLSTVIVNMILKRYSEYESYEDYMKYKARDANGALIDYGTETLLKDVRGSAMRCFWERTREAPHATNYKKVAGTAFLHICEKWGRLEEGFGTLQNLWY